MTRARGDKTRRDVAILLSQNYRDALPLLDADQPFTFTDFETIPIDLWRRMAESGVIHQTEDYSPKNRQWRLAEPARKRLEEYRDAVDEYPEGTKVCPHCGYRGFRNVPGAGYQCSNTQCEREFDAFAEVGSA